LKLLIIVFLSLFISAQAIAVDYRLNLSLNPVGLIFGVANLGLDWAPSDNFTVGASYATASLSDDDIEIESNGFGLKLQYFFYEAFNDSWYMATSYNSSHGEALNVRSLREEKIDLYSFTASLGYMWISGPVNFQLGIGVQQIFLDEQTPGQNSFDFSSFEGVLPYADFNLGFAFGVF